MYKTSNYFISYRNKYQQMLKKGNCIRETFISFLNSADIYADTAIQKDIQQ